VNKQREVQTIAADVQIKRSVQEMIGREVQTIGRDAHLSPSYGP
jgi:hypothetical protein